ncbi:PPC domain-containing protein [Hyalangium rubrum]|uniref:PPC domain-containing protein n=1 Tax=Hyalangium rubrum TaxID=3103134 RepID=A0ABU5GWJ2_9BACT|nr:PPC domain-containing protein [Hyalangium sp. s54d21]MDY7225563.1 PPC domain-containing protein [Hyalangium sp. s54d21]
MNPTFAKTVMMSCLTALVACGPEMAGDEEVVLESAEPGQEFQVAQEPLNEVELSAADCSSTYTLSNNSSRTGLGVADQGWSCIYTMAVPAGATNLKFETTGGTGDADLYVKFGSTPTSSEHDCKSAGGTSVETCSPTTVQTGTYYVRLYGYTASSGITLKGSYTPGSPPPASCTTTYSLSNGVTRTGVTTVAGYWSCIYTLSVPTGATDLKFETTGGTGDADLYVKFGTTPTESSHDCKSAGGTSAETCTIAAPVTGTYYVRMYGYGSSTGISLRGSYTPNSSPTSCNVTDTLSNGTPKTGVSAASQAWSCIYKLTVPAGMSSVTFQTTGGTGDADLYVRSGYTPTEAMHDCKSAGNTNTEVCTIYSPAAGTYYVRLYGYAAASGITLTGRY